MSDAGPRPVVHALARRLDAFPGVALEVDASGRICFANARLRQLVGDVEGQALDAVLDENSVAKWRRALLDDGPGVSVELHLRARDGTAPHTFFVSSAEQGQRTVIELPRDPDMERLQEAASAMNSELVNTQREVMQQKAELMRTLTQLREAYDREEQLASDLRAHNEEIEVQNEELLSLTEELREQQERTEDLNAQLTAQAEELQHVLQSRERFYSAMSHELRTPLTAVLGYTHLLLDGIAGTLTEQQRGFVDRSHSAAIHLKSLIDDVLDLAKLESGALELELEQTNIQPLADELVQTVMPLAREHSSVLLLELDGAPEFLTTDSRALRQILLNLLSNAVKFGAGRPVRLRCTRADHDVVFEVVDRGIGIPPEHIERVFEEFVQLEPGTRQGTGLGLSISKRLAARLGGRLDVESTPGTGSTFRLTLPLSGPAAP